MREGYWRILKDCKCSEFGDNEPCKHCRDDHIRENTAHDGSTYPERVWTCSYVVEAFNGGGFNSTGVCLECIVEAARELLHTTVQTDEDSV